MSVSIAIALGSALCAAFSALFAWFTWTEARRSNQLSLHTRRLEIYRTVLDLRHVLQTKGLAVETRDVAKFSRVLSEARFCFKNKDTGAAIQAYYAACFELGELNRKKSRPNVSASKRAEIEAKQDQTVAAEESRYSVAIRLVEKELYSSL